MMRWPSDVKREREMWNAVEQGSLLAEIERLEGVIAYMREPCTCDPVRSGEEYCNGGCELRLQNAILRRRIAELEGMLREVIRVRRRVIAEILPYAMSEAIDALESDAELSLRSDS